MQALKSPQSPRTPKAYRHSKRVDNDMEVIAEARGYSPAVLDLEEQSDNPRTVEIPLCTRCLAQGAFFGALLGVGIWELGRAIILTLAAR